MCEAEKVCRVVQVDLLRFCGWWPHKPEHGPNVPLATALGSCQVLERDIVIVHGAQHEQPAPYHGDEDSLYAMKIYDGSSSAEDLAVHLLKEPAFVVH